MDSEHNPRKLPALALVAAFTLAVVGGILAAAGPVAAHNCDGSSHSSCNGHQCPDDGVAHDHYTSHAWWWDHWCRSAPATGAIFGPQNALDLHEVIDLGA